ncbi:zinc finger (CCCH type) protein, putative [Eimeria maxima]|uniref:Zinc finger (CCCH type) protein, putative n=1 Tax=Eimeria maxima TaxID=5804 RepID=U6M4I7_EIMMA|nr:zinc finger (CCCH type) protein, putative [Eimeria maxima]CDJ56570.1 zinc finger (CCCH type) protein, putative [Eimeria maxima]
MESRLWQELQAAQHPSAVAATLPVTGVPMKGVILANRKTIFHKTRLCPRLTSGSCHLGARCNFAHTEHELRPAPNLDKTKLCPSVLHPGTACPANAKGETCRFAHSKAEIRHTTNMFKTNMCLKWIRGKCKKEAQCNHAHGHQELKYYRAVAMASGGRDFARESEATMSRRRKQGGAVGAVGGGNAASTSRLSLLKETVGGSTRERASGRSSRNNGNSREQQPPKNSCESVNAALAALYEELLKGASRREAIYGSAGGVGTPLQDDSTTATDELSDFSSFSSRGLSEALCSAPAPTTTVNFGSCGGPLHASASDVFSTTAPSSCAGTPTASLSSNNDLKLEVDRLLLLRALAGESGGLLMGACDPQEEERNQAAATAAAGNLTTERDSMRQLEANLARLCLGDVTARHYPDPPPGFEHLQQQHAVVDLERLATADGFD